VLVIGDIVGGAGVNYISLTRPISSLPYRGHGLWKQVKGGERLKDSKIPDVTALDDFTTPDGLKDDFTPLDQAVELDPPSSLLSLPAYEFHDYKIEPTGESNWYDERGLVYHSITDLTDNLVNYAPLNREVPIKCTISKFKWTTSIKVSMTEMPNCSRPVRAKEAWAGFNAITGRLYRKENIRKHKLQPRHEARMFFETYCRKDWQDTIRMYQQEPVGYDVDALKRWLSDRPDAIKISEELEQILEEGFELHHINDIKIHNKLESLLKEDPTGIPQEDKVRVIVWQAKGICAIFAPVFAVAKNRMKDVMSEEFIYTDGLNPDQLSSASARVKGDLYFTEDDLTKQDRQTDHDTLDVEMEIYLSLGLDKRLVSIWRTCHDSWKWRASGMTGVLDAMRLTGQATTALGNAIVNMLVHMRTVRRYRSSIELMLILGDDNLLVSKIPISAKQMRASIKDYYNMMSKAVSRKNVGVFCRWIFYMDGNNQMRMGPDYIRLRHRYEYTNGVSEASDELLESRTLSYLTMLGDSVNTRQVLKKMGRNVELPRWHDPAATIAAVSSYYGCTALEVELEISRLLKMMSERHKWEHTFKLWRHSTK
jgi:hypothetical protein